MNSGTGWFDGIKSSLSGAALDIAPILLVIFFFQAVALRKAMPHFRRIAFGFTLVIAGLGIFLVGLEECVFPLGTQMARQLTDASFLTKTNGGQPLPVLADGAVDPRIYFWIYIFAFSMGFSATLAEPALIAVALKARDISSGAISPWGLRTAVALGVAVGVTLGSYRIVTGTPLHVYISASYAVLMIQTYFAPKIIVPLAYDSGGVTTSTVTVPILVALGIGMASSIPGRSPLLDGFGLIAFACLFSVIAVLAYAMIAEKMEKRPRRAKTP